MWNQAKAVGRKEGDRSGRSVVQTRRDAPQNMELRARVGGFDTDLPVIEHPTSLGAVICTESG
jgi:hypothetical protein